MILSKNILGMLGFAAAIGVTMSGVVAKADAYTPGDFLKLDLNHAVLSPKLLGPSAQFEPVQIEAKEPADESEAASLSVPAKKAAVRAPIKHARVAALRKPAHPHRNPLDAYAADTRIQVWPCKSGGICSWQQ